MAAEIDPLILIKDWLEAKEPHWYLRLSVAGTQWVRSEGRFRSFCTLNVGNTTRWIGWIDGPYTDDQEVMMWGVGAGHTRIDLKAPDSFERIHKFLSERMQYEEK